MKMREFLANLMCRQVEFDQIFMRERQMRDAAQPVLGWNARPIVKRVGWVTGIRWLRTGYTVDMGWEEGRVFRETGPRQMCYLVVHWPTTKPWKVPPEAVKVLEEPVKPSYWTEDLRQFMSEDSQNWPRASDGKFVPVPPRGD